MATGRDNDDLLKQLKGIPRAEQIAKQLAKAQKDLIVSVSDFLEICDNLDEEQEAKVQKITENLGIELKDDAEDDLQSVLDTETSSQNKKNTSLEEIPDDPLAEALNQKRATPEEQIEWQRKIYSARLLQSVLDTNTEELSEEEKKTVQAILKQAQPTKEKVLKDNLRLVKYFAGKYRRLDPNKRTFADLMQDGIIGLWSAVEKYDYAQGWSFSTYASWWIRQSIERTTTEENHSIHLPTYLIELYARVKKTSTTFEKETGRAPTDEELSKQLNAPIKKIQKVKSVEFENVVKLVSLQTLVSPDENDSSELGDFVADPAQSVEESGEQNELGALLVECLDDLAPKEARIIKMRYGLDGFSEHTLEECGAKFKVSRERIRQIEVKAIAKLQKNPRTVKKLQGYLSAY